MGNQGTYSIAQSRQEVWRRYASSLKGTTTLLLNYARDRARRKNLVFELDREWLQTKLEAGKCELTGLPFSREYGQPYKAAPFGPSLDRIVPSIGYTKENTRVICFIANRAKSDWNDEILKKFALGLLTNNT